MRRGRETAWIGMILAFTLISPLWSAQGKSVHLCDFEDIPMQKWSDTVYDIPTALKKPSYPSNDYDWNTGGYARIEPAEKREAYRLKNEPLGKFMRGKYSAKVRFTVPGEYRVLTGEGDPQNWESGMTLSTETPTRSPLTDWSEYKTISLDVFNPAKEELQLFIRIVDSASTVFEKSANLVSGSSTIQLDLADMDAIRVNIADIRSITLYLDTAKMEKGPELYLDNLQLNTEPLPVYAATGDEEEEEFEFDEDEEDELSEDALRKFGGRLKEAPLSE